MWTYTYDTTLLANLSIKSAFKDGVLKFYQVYPCEGYVLRILSSDEYQMDEEGNIVLDENGNPIIIPYRSYGGATALPNYDWATNPRGFCAELYEDGMIVYGNPNDNNHEVM